MMSTAALVFMFIAAVLTAVCLLWLLRPLWGDGAGRRTAAVTALLLAGGAAGIYAYTSQWTWPEEVSAADNPATMVSRLARRLEREPNDVQGWLLLGRSHATLGQYPLAVRAYQRADRLEGGRNAEAILGIAEALVMQAGGAVDERTGRLFEQALALEPQSENALFFAAIAAQRRGEFPLAIERFERLLAQDPPDNVRGILQQQIERLRSGTAADPQPPSAVGSEQPPSAVGGEQPRVIVAVSIKPSLADRVPPGSTLFVFVRAPDRPGPPLAVKRLPAAFPVSVELTAADSMVPGVSFAPNDTVEVSAKVSADGSATPKSGDPIGSTRYIVGRDFKKSVVIDRLTP